MKTLLIIIPVFLFAVSYFVVSLYNQDFNLAHWQFGDKLVPFIFFAAGIWSKMDKTYFDR